MIRGLLVVEQRLLLGFAIAGALLFGAAATHIGFNDVFVFPNSRYSRDMLWVWVVAAGGMGMLLGSLDTIFGTEEYAALRPVHPRTRLLVRAFGCFAVAAVWLIAPLLWLAAFGSHDLPGDYMGLGLAHLAWGTIVFSSAALGLYLVNLPVSWWMRGVLATACAMVLVWLVLTYAERRSMRMEPGTWALANLLTTALLLHAALWSNQCLRDADRPLWIKAYWPIGLGCVATVLVADYGLREWTRHPNMQHPRISTETVADSEGDNSQLPQFILTRHFRGKNGHWQSWETDRFGQSKRPITEYTTLKFDATDYVARHQNQYRNTDVRLSARHRDTRAHLPRGEGRVSVFDRDRLTDRVARIDAGKTAAQRPFSDTASLCRVVSIRPDDATFIPVVVGDPEDGQLWFLNRDMDPAHFEPISLPDEDSFFQWSAKHSTRPAVVIGELPSSRDLVLGRKYEYQLDLTERTFTKRITDEVVTARFDRVHRLNVDPIFPQLQVRDLAGNAIYDVEFEPSSAQQWLQATGLWAQSLLRAPALQTVRWCKDAEQSLPTYYSGPHSLVRGRNYTGLLLLNWTLALGLAWFARRRLLRLGANQSKANTWSIAIALCGAALFPLYLLLERARRWQAPAMVEPRESVSPLIRSA